MLMADIKCLDLLLKSDITKLYQWQYFINQPGTALPTMKVDEIAQVLNQYKGHCDSVVYTPHKLCPKDSIYSIRNSTFDDRYRYQFKLRYILKSIHFKNTVTRSSFHSKLWPFSIINQLTSEHFRIDYFVFYEKKLKN